MQRHEEDKLDVALRPQTFDDFIGQKRLTQNLKIYVEAAQKRNDPLDHILFTGLPGLGKTTLALIIARELQVQLISTTGPALERSGDLAGILTNLKPRDVLFIDEIHRIPAPVEEYLYSAMEDFSIFLTLDKGPHARTLKLDVPPFTLIGSTTREGLLSDPFRARFGVMEKLEPYPPEDIVLVFERNAQRLGIGLTPEAACLLAKRSRGIPRMANRLLRRARDFAQVKNLKVINEEMAQFALEKLEIDDYGLSSVDRKLIQILLEAPEVPVGLKTLAASLGEAEDTLEDVYEPYLLQLGLIQKTPKGRKATSKTRLLFGKDRHSSPQKALFS